MRAAVVKLGEDYERRFPEEFEKEVLYLKNRYSTAYTYTCCGTGFFITSDNPIVEVGYPSERLLFFAFSPYEFIRLSPGRGELTVEETSFEDFANGMTWSAAFNYVFSHRSDVDISKYQQVAEKHGMLPREETERMVLSGYSGEVAAKFPQEK